MHDSSSSYNSLWPVVFLNAAFLLVFALSYLASKRPDESRFLRVFRGCW